MFICDVKYCDFSVFTFPTEEEDSLPHIERIFRDADLENVLVAIFFCTCLRTWALVYVLVKSFSTSDSTKTSQLVQSDDNAASSTQGSDVFCYHHGPDEGSMIACNNSTCKIEWFIRAASN